MSKRVVIFGMGAIGRSIVDQWRESPPAGHRLVGVCARPWQVDDLIGQLPPGTAVVTDIAALLRLDPDIVVECAGHQGAIQIAEAALCVGADLYLLSVGVLADEQFRGRLRSVAAEAGSQVVIPAGALAGFDGLAAVARSGGAHVRYISKKPPQAWMDTPAEHAFDLMALGQATPIFEGNAAEAARLFPKNANLAAAVAIAGIGFDRTEVVLIADPEITDNYGIIEARSPTSIIRVEVSGRSEADNPKSSAIVGTSVLSALDGQSGSIVFA